MVCPVWLPLANSRPALAEPSTPPQVIHHCRKRAKLRAHLVGLGRSDSSYQYKAVVSNAGFWRHFEALHSPGCFEVHVQNAMGRQNCHQLFPLLPLLDVVHHTPVASSDTCTASWDCFCCFCCLFLFLLQQQGVSCCTTQANSLKAFYGLYSILAQYHALSTATTILAGQYH